MNLYTYFWFFVRLIFIRNIESYEYESEWFSSICVFDVAYCVSSTRIYHNGAFGSRLFVGFLSFSIIPSKYLFHFSFVWLQQHQRTYKAISSNWVVSAAHFIIFIHTIRFVCSILHKYIQIGDSKWLVAIQHHTLEVCATSHLIRKHL